MTRLGFLLARLRGDEAALKRLSAGRAAINAGLAGKSVAIVGNARALADTSNGADIDAADLVIRLNGAPMTSPESHGTRTDWLAISVPVPTLSERKPRRILWMSPKRKHLSWAVARSPGFYLHDPADWHALAERLGSRPSTGAMTIDLVAGAPAARITLYGFDFFASKSLSGRREAAQVPHDFAAEARMVRHLLAADTRFTLVPL